jgi:predicted nucleic acid-binding Zn ribbon protein
MNTNLLASIALFGELYKSNKKESLWDILADFIKGAVSFENRYTLTSVEVNELLSKVYGFDKIPESVIRTTLNNKLKDCVKSENGSFNFDASRCTDTNRTISNVQEINKKQQSVLEKLYNYIVEKKNLTTEQLSKSEVWEQLAIFLMDNDYTNDLSELISSFIIHNNDGINDCLNLIKEGLILYKGLCYSETEDINQLGSWKNELTIYLSTEHLFSSVGFNGDVYKEIFDDFKNLVNEINRSETGDKKKGIIHLKYFEETKEEIENFFYAAENIIKYHQNYDQTKTAMVSILKDCKKIDDVKEKQAKFYADLKHKHIELQEYSFDNIKPEHNVVDGNLIERLKNDAETNHKSFDEDYCIQCLQMFSKINNQRNGVNNVSLEKIKYIYVTENRFALYLGHNNKVKINETDTSFAKDIDYIITRFWFKLNKGFGKNTSIPKTFDVLTRARIIISSHISSSLSEKYDELNKKVKDGSLTKEQAVELNELYKKQRLLPENINDTNIDDTFDFLTDDTFLENFLREKAKQEQKRQETEDKLRETERENQVIKAESSDTKAENQSLKERISYLEQREKDRNEAEEKQKLEQQEKERKERMEQESNEYAENEWNILKKSHRKNTRYMILVFLISLLPISIGLVLSICQPIKNYLNSINEKSMSFIVLGIILLYVIEGFGSKYLFDKDKIKNGWKFLFNHKIIQNKELERLKTDYIQKQENH